MKRCPSCNGYLVYEPALTDTPARIKCTVCGWMLSDPNFRKEKPRYFPADSVDRRIEWQQEHPDFDLYEPSSAACQLGISVNFSYALSEERLISASHHGRGKIACNTVALQMWWDGKNHHG